MGVVVFGPAQDGVGQVGFCGGFLFAHGAKVELIMFGDFFQIRHGLFVKLDAHQIFAGLAKHDDGVVGF